MFDYMIPFLFLILSIHSFVTYNIRNPYNNVIGSVFLFTSLFVIYIYLIDVTVASILEKVDKQLGNMAYFLYLIHMPIVLFFDKTFVLNRGFIPFLLAIASSITLSFVLYRLIEFPIMTIRDQFRGKSLYT